jgi:putative membrane-bound dehydrogenase-like protein
LARLFFSLFFFISPSQHRYAMNRITTRITLLLLGYASLLLNSLLLGADDFTPTNTQAAGEHPLPPAEAAGRLSVPEGFQVTLAAAEPDVRQPIAIAFDDRGRLWVAESYSYNGSKFTDEPHDRILIFEDTTGDGVLDRRTVFREGLTRLTGLQLGFGGVWITTPPTLSFIPDRNHDDSPDGEPITHLDGWSLDAEHNSVNGLTWGPDGWLYGRHGIKQPSLVGPPGVADAGRVELSCSIWRYHPMRHVFEVVADGTINPWGLDFDDHGQGFLTTSVVEHLWHLTPGAHYERWKDRGAHPDPFVYEAMSATSDHLHWGSGTWDKAGRVAEGNQDFGGGHSHCDAMIYLGDRWPDPYRGSLFTSNIHGRRVNRDRLTRGEGPFRGEHDVDFLRADDPWFRAVSMEYGPDGDVYLTDWSDNGECHDRDGVHRTSGRIYKITWGDPLRVRFDLESATNKQLVEYQLHRNDWFVRHARRLLQERAAMGQDMSAAQGELRAMFDGQDEVTRKLRALWALWGTGGVEPAWLIELLAHESEHVRGWAVRLLADGVGSPKAGDSGDVARALLALAAGERSWLARMELASALRRLPLKTRLDVAMELVQQPATSDPNLDRMIWYAIQPAIAQDPGRGLALAAVAPPRLRRWTARRLVGHSRDASALLFDAIDRSTNVDVTADLLQGVLDGLDSVDLGESPDSARRIVVRLIDHDDPRVRVPALTVAAAIGDEAVVQRIRRVLHADDQDEPVRLAALAGLVSRQPPGLAADLRRLIANEQLTAAALRASVGVQDALLWESILERYPRMSAELRSAAIDVFVARAESADLLLAAVERKQIAASEISAAQARQIEALRNTTLLERLESVWGTARRSPADRVKRMRELEQLLTPENLALADLAHGRELFRNTCSSCHRLFGDGRTIGPELTGANRRNPQYLVSNVVDPSAAVPADFRQATVITVDGRVITGAVSQRTDTTVTIQTANGEVRLPARDVDELTISPQSMMPDGLLDKLTEDQTRDLFAWLMSDGAPPIATTTTDTAAPEAEDGQLPLVILLGDSIRMNYQQTVIAELQGEAEVWAPEENGQHTVFTLENLEKWIGDRQPAVVHINVGLHDMFLNAKTGQPRHDVDTYSASLRRIFDRLKALTNAKIIFALTTPVDESRQAASQTYGRVVRRSADIQRYNEAARRVAQAAGVSVNDVHALAEQVGAGDILCESDGIHLSDMGQTVIGRGVASVIEAALTQDAAPPNR